MKRPWLPFLVGALFLLGLYGLSPIFQGFHFGCDGFDHLRIIRLGLEFCK
jgi:hypothetical protein